MMCLGEHADEPVLTQLVLKRHVCKGCQHAPPILDVDQIHPKGLSGLNSGYRLLTNFQGIYREDSKIR